MYSLEETYYLGKQGGLLYARSVKLRVVSSFIYALLRTFLLMRLAKLFPF